jgi:hypothetical protein
MSSPRPAGAQGSIGRPAVVTAAARLYVAAAALAATYAVLVFTQVGTVADAEGLAEAAHLDTNSNVVAIATSFALLGVAGLIFAGLFTRSGVHLLRGSYGSRGGAWGAT